MKFDEPHFHSENAARALIESVRWPTEPPRDRRRLFGMSHAASLCSSSMA